jgi:integrase
MVTHKMIAKPIKTHHPENERMKRRYRQYLMAAMGYSEASLDAVDKALSRFEMHTRYRDFRAFHPEQAKSFRTKLAEQASTRTGDKLSKATLYSTMRHLRSFFKWLADKPGYRSKLEFADADYFKLSENDTRIAKAHRDPIAPTIEQITKVLATMPTMTDTEKRDRALIAFTLLTGGRDGALVGFKLKHIDLVERYVFQDAREVKTKRRKTFTTWFFPVGPEPLAIFTEYVEDLRARLLWGDADPLFPRTAIKVGSMGTFEQAGLERSHWSSARAIRAIFRQAFERAGLPYFNPHSLRKTLANFGQRICKTAEEWKAWTQNLGHEHVVTTWTSYGAVAPARQAELMRALGQPRPDLDNDRAVREALRVLVERTRHLDAVPITSQAS